MSGGSQDERRHEVAGNTKTDTSATINVTVNVDRKMDNETIKEESHKENEIIKQESHKKK